MGCGECGIELNYAKGGLSFDKCDVSERLPSRIHHVLVSSKPSKRVVAPRLETSKRGQSAFFGTLIGTALNGESEFALAPSSELLQSIRAALWIIIHCVAAIIAFC